MWRWEMSGHNVGSTVYGFKLARIGAPLKAISQNLVVCQASFFQ